VNVVAIVQPGAAHRRVARGPHACRRVAVGAWSGGRAVPPLGQRPQTAV